MMVVAQRAKDKPGRRDSQSIWEGCWLLVCQKCVWSTLETLESWWEKVQYRLVRLKKAADVKPVSYEIGRAHV